MNKLKNKLAKPKYNMWQNSAYMIKLAWREKEKKVVLLCVIQAMLTVIINLLNLYISPTVLSILEQKSPLSELLIAIMTFVALLMIFSALLSYVEANTLYGRITVRGSLLNAINKKSSLTSYPNIEENKFIILRTKSSKAVQSNIEATEAIWNTLSCILQNFIGFSIYIILLSSIDIWLIFLIIITTVTGYLISKKLNNYGYIHREEESQYENKLSYIIGLPKDYSTAKDIRIFGLKPWITEITNKASNAYIAFHKGAESVYFWGSMADVILAFLRNIIAYAYLINGVLNHGLTVAEFLLYFSAINGFTAWINGLLGDMTKLYRQSIDICILREYLEYPEQFLFEKGKTLDFSKEIPYELRLENVSFKYPNAKINTLTNINLTLHPGEKLAIVGLNGAGKTTLVKLMCGFLDPTSGKVLLNGCDIRQYNRRHYYDMFSAVFQDFSILAGTIATNVAQSEDDLDINRVKDCLAKAGLTGKIKSLPHGYDSYLNRTVYENAVSLSGGETQRLMLARALYKNAPFIILDEPTAALDPIAEADMYEKYNEMTCGRSSIYISHRLASTRFCNRIIYIEDQSIAEEGTHEYLLKLGGKYANLFQIQSKYYKEDNVTHE